MRKIVLTARDVDMFNRDITPTEFEFFHRHKDAFRRMWTEQGKKFWVKFIICYRSYTVNHGFLLDFSIKSDMHSAFIDEGFICIHENFVDGKFSNAKNFLMDVVIVTQNQHTLQHLGSKSYVKDPFFFKDTRDAFRRLFGPPSEKSSYLKVYVLLPLYMKFGGSICVCLRRWLMAVEQDPDDESYWEPPETTDDVRSPPEACAIDFIKARILGQHYPFTMEDDLEKTISYSLGSDQNCASQPGISPLDCMMCNMSVSAGTPLAHSPAIHDPSIMNPAGGDTQSISVISKSDKKKRRRRKGAKGSKTTDLELNSAVDAGGDNKGTSTEETSGHCKTELHMQCGKCGKCGVIEAEPKSSLLNPPTSEPKNTSTKSTPTNTVRVSKNDKSTMTLPLMTNGGVSDKRHGDKSQIKETHPGNVLPDKKDVMIQDSAFDKKTKKNSQDESPTIEDIFGQELSDDLLRDNLDKKGKEVHRKMIEKSMEQAQTESKCDPSGETTSYGLTENDRVMSSKTLNAPATGTISKEPHLDVKSKTDFTGKMKAENKSKLEAASAKSPTKFIDKENEEIHKKMDKFEKDGDFIALISAGKQLIGGKKDSGYQNFEELQAASTAKRKGETLDTAEKTAAQSRSGADAQTKSEPLDEKKHSQTSGRKLRVCSGCGIQEPVPKTYKKCQKCKQLGVKAARFYCGRDCQVADWGNRHKKEHKENMLD